MSELTLTELQDDVFYSPTRQEPYSVRREQVDRSVGIVAATKYLEKHNGSMVRSLLNVIARVVTWMGKK